MGCSENGTVPKQSQPIRGEKDSDVVYWPTEKNKQWMLDPLSEDIINQFAYVLKRFYPDKHRLYVMGR